MKGVSSLILLAGALFLAIWDMSEGTLWYYLLAALMCACVALNIRTFVQQMLIRGDNE